MHLLPAMLQVMLLKIEVGKEESLADGIKAALRRSTVQHCEVWPGLRRSSALLQLHVLTEY